MENQKYISECSTILVKIVQQEIAQVLMPIFELFFSDSSFGFRPQRGVKDVIEKVVDN